MLTRVINKSQIYRLNQSIFNRWYSSKPEGQPISETTYPASAAPEGTKLKGINYIKNQQDPVAKADSEYPQWLWTLLDPKPKTDILSRDYQRSANKKKIKQANFLKQK